METLKTDHKSLLDAERKLIHLLINGKIEPAIQAEFPPEAFDPHHHLLVKSIYSEFAENKQVLTRDRYKQQLARAGAAGDLMQNLSVYDRCSVGVHAKPEQLGELKELVREGYACARLYGMTQMISEGRKTGYQKVFDKLRDAVLKEPVGGQELEIVTLSDVIEEDVQWLWENRVAVGKLTLFIGDPCCGKSFVTLNMAARISKGLALPGSSSPTDAGDTIILSSEDGIADTIVKRYRLQGGDLARVHVVKCSGGKVFSIETDLPLLANALKQFPETRMIVVDPLNAYLGKADAYKESEVRRVLTPLCDFAERNKIAIVGIQHLTKTAKGTAMYRGLGSIAFAAAARAVWAFCKDIEDEDRRLMVEVKSNLGPSPGGLAYRINAPDNPSNPSMVAWESEPVIITANEALAERRAMPRTQAREWLETVLEDGAMASKDIFELAEKQGISAATLKRAKKDLHIAARQVTDHWEWSLPAAEKNKPNADF